MKTSKIIFISLLSIIALLILAAFIDIRINGQRNGEQTNIKVKKQAIPIFKVLCVNNSKYIEIIKSDSTYIKATWPKDSLAPSIKYTIKMDTLILSDIERYVGIKIYTNDSLNRMILRKSKITVSSIVSSKISIDMDESFLWFNLDDNNQTSINTMEVIAKSHSDITVGRVRLNSLSIILINSEANLSINSKKICATLSDSSSISARQSEEMLMKKIQQVKYSYTISQSIYKQWVSLLNSKLISNLIK